MSLSSRIARLEAAIGGDEPHGEDCAAWRKVWQVVAPFITAQYRDQTGRELRRLTCRTCLEADAATLGFAPIGRLAQVVHFLMLDAMTDTQPRPVALPLEVAAVYLDDGHAWPKHACRVCGYRVPWAAAYEYHRGGVPMQHVQVPERRPFPRCPLCGGPTGPAPFASVPDDEQRRA